MTFTILLLTHFWAFIGQTIAPSPTSDCSGALEPTTHVHSGMWALGSYVGQAFIPVLYFNTRNSAVMCKGDSAFVVRKLTRNGWMEH